MLMNCTLFSSPCRRYSFGDTKMARPTPAPSKFEFLSNFHFMVKHQSNSYVIP